MNPSHSDLIRNLVIKDIVQTEATAMGVLAALLIANNQSSDEYDTEEEQEEYDEDEEEEEEEEIEEVEEVEGAVTLSVPMPIPLAMPVPVALPRKRSHSELRDETPLPLSQAARNKRVRLATIPDNGASPNYNTNLNTSSVQVQQPRNAAGINILNPATSIDIPKHDYNQTLRPLYTPEHVIASVPSSHPFANVLVRACADMMYRFRGKTSEKNLAIMATRMWREPREASMYDLLSEKNKQIFFEKWVGEVRLGQWTPKPVEPRYQSAAGESYTVTTTTTTIQRLRPDVLKLVDASSKGRLDDRVRLWLSNVQPN